MAAAPGLHPALSHRLSVPETLDEGLAITRASLRGSCLYACLFLGISTAYTAGLLRESLLDDLRAVQGLASPLLSRALLIVMSAAALSSAGLAWWWLSQLHDRLGIGSAGLRRPGVLGATLGVLLVVSLRILPAVCLHGYAMEDGGVLWLRGSWFNEGERWGAHAFDFLVTLVLAPAAGLVLPIMITEGRDAFSATLRALGFVLRSMKLVLLGLTLWLFVTGLGIAAGLPLARRSLVELDSFKIAIDIGVSQLVIETLLAPVIATVYFIAYLQIRRRQDGLDVEWAARRAGLWGVRS